MHSAEKIKHASYTLEAPQIKIEARVMVFSISHLLKSNVIRL